MPVKTYKQVNIAQTIVWDGKNTDEVLTLIGDAFIDKGDTWIEFRLKEPNHYGHDSLTLQLGGTFTRFYDGSVTNYPNYQFDKDGWELIKKD